MHQTNDRFVNPSGNPLQPGTVIICDNLPFVVSKNGKIYTFTGGSTKQSYNPDPGSLASISLWSTCNYTTQYQACFSLFCTSNACKTKLKYCIYINQSDVKQLKYQQFTLHWVDTLR